jgi:hypothetical protein
MKNFRWIAIMALLSAMVMMGMACSSNEQPGKAAGMKQEGQPVAAAQKEQTEGMAKQAGQTANEPAAAAQQAASAQMPKPVELTGTVEQGSEGIVFVTNLGKYAVTGQDLSEMVGKTLKVTGALEESGGQYTINVQSFKESE